MKKKLHNIVICIVFIMFMSITTSYTAFQMYNWGARPVALGNAFVGIADDANCMSYNIAGVGIVKKQELQALYAKPFMGVENVELGFISLKYVGVIKGLGKIGIAVDQFNAGGLYTEFCYAAGLADIIYKMQDGTEIYAGGKVKYLGHSYSYDESLKSYAEFYGDSVVNTGSSKSGITLDLGLIAKKDFITVGVAVENVTQPDLGIKYEDKVPMLIRVGGSYFVPKQKLILSAEVDLRQQSYGENNMEFGLGGEYGVSKDIVLRAGYSTKGITVGAGLATVMQEKYLLGLDAAYVINSGEIGGNDLQLTVKLKW